MLQWIINLQKRRHKSQLSQVAKKNSPTLKGKKYTNKRTKFAAASSSSSSSSFFGGLCVYVIQLLIPKSLKQFKYSSKSKKLNLKKFNTGSLSLILVGIRNEHHHHPFLARKQDPKETRQSPQKKTE